MEALLTPVEVSKALKISKSKAYRLMWSGDIVSLKFDKSRRVRSIDLQTYIDKAISAQAQLVKERTETIQYLKKSRTDGKID